MADEKDSIVEKETTSQMSPSLGPVGFTTSSMSAPSTTVVSSSVELGLAKWSRKTQDHRTHPRLTSSDPFRLQFTTITQGQQLGHNTIVLVPVSKKPFPFLELSAEIRNMIYKYAFTFEEEIPVGNSRSVIYYAPGKIVKNSITGRKLILRQKHDISLLLVCKQINQEGTGMLYSQNVFVLSRASSASAFFKSIGQNWQHVRAIRLIEAETQGRPGDWQGSQKLANLPKLSTVDIGENGILHMLACRETDVESISAVLAPVFVSLYRRSRNREEVFRAFGLNVEPELIKCTCWMCGGVRKYGSPAHKRRCMLYMQDEATGERYVARLKEAMMDVTEYL